MYVVDSSCIYCCFAVVVCLYVVDIYIFTLGLHIDGSCGSVYDSTLYVYIVCNAFYTIEITIADGEVVYGVIVSSFDKYSISVWVMATSYAVVVSIYVDIVYDRVMCYIYGYCPLGRELDRTIKTCTCLGIGDDTCTITHGDLLVVD